MSFSNLLIVLLVVFLWSFNAVAVKLGVQEIPPLLMTTLRFVMVAMIVVPFTRLHKNQVKLVICLSFTFGVLHFSMLFLGFSHVDGGTAVLIDQLGTPIATLLAVIFLKERMYFHQAVGLLLSFAGVAIISGGPSIPNGIYLIILLVSAAGWGWSNILVKSGPSIHPVTMLGWSSFFAIPQVALASYLFEDHQWAHLAEATWRGWGGVVYSAVGSSLLAYSMWYSLFKKLPVNKVMPYSLLCPVGAIALGCLVMHESLTPDKVTGAAVVILGVALSSVTRPLRSISWFKHWTRSTEA